MNKLFSISLLLCITTISQAQIAQLKLNLKSGDAYRHVVSTNETMSTEVDGEKSETRATIDYTLLLTVAGVLDNAYEIEARFEKIRLINYVEEDSMTFSSEIKNAYDLYSTIMGAMTNQPFTMKLSDKGTVLRIDDITPICEQAIEQIPNLMEVQKNQFKDMILSIVGPPILRRNFEMANAVFPQKEDMTGDEWMVENHPEEGIVSAIETNFKVTDISADAYIITGHSTLDTSRKDLSIDNGDAIYKMTGSMLSTIKLDKKTGLATNAKLNRELTGEIKIKTDTELPKKLPMTIKTDIKVTNSRIK